MFCGCTLPWKAATTFTPSAPEKAYWTTPVPIVDTDKKHETKTTQEQGVSYLERQQDEKTF